ncbi:hypothetical protein Ddye_020012 [Dipteronia dyeriana]|uniref:Myb/SANT-like domain-containing protein n=1 Tax=Dipteronia dyeriana TaxID=168575 RepID=A0AAD9TZF7_9ROSI|nr:hypothetical protein Ddye_020012 [Dipteronia dyeriana]
MGKKNTNSITENERGGKSKAIWNDDLVAIYCEICVKEVAKGNRHGTHFDKIGWVNVVKVLKEITGRDYDKKQLKNKWDPAKKTVDAPPEWWQSKIETNVEYQKFRDVGISPDMMDMYDKMFNGSTAVGNCVMIPSSTILPEEMVEDSEYDKQTVDRENEEASHGNQDKGKKRTNDESEINKGVTRGSKGKKGKLGGAAKLSKQIDRLVEVVESKSTATSVHRSSQGTSIAEVMEVVATLPGAEKGQGIRNRNAQERFQRSGETVSRSTPQEILSDSRYMPYFKDCIGAIDGVHIQASISPCDQVPYIGRKGIPTQNVMAICNFDMQFTFAFTQIITVYYIIIIYILYFIFSGKYYLVDAGYPQMKDFLGPYKGERYHIPHFRRCEEPTGHKEIFNHAHSSLWSIIERTFGKVKIVIVTMAIHNYIRRYAQRDRDFDESTNYSSEEINEEMEVNTHEEDGPGRREMEILRNSIAQSLMNGGYFFHQRCACHIINLIVLVGSKQVIDQIDRIRDAIS